MKKQNRIETIKNVLMQRGFCSINELFDEIEASQSTIRRDLNLLEDIAESVAVSMEKEYLREQLTEREKELSVINRSSAILTSSLDIEEIFDRFIGELRNVIDVSWAAVVLINDSDLHFMALSSEIGSAWKAGEQVPIKGTAAEWLATHKKAMVESDLSLESQFVSAASHLKQGVRS